MCDIRTRKRWWENPELIDHSWRCYDGEHTSSLAAADTDTARDIFISVWGAAAARGPPHWRLCLLRRFSPAATSFYKIQSWGPPFLETRTLTWRIEGPAIIAPASICSTYDNTQETLVFIFWPRRVASGGMMGTGAADDGNSRVASGGMGAADGGNTRLSLTSCVLCLLWMVGLWGPLPIVYMCSDRHN